MSIKKTAMIFCVIAVLLQLISIPIHADTSTSNHGFTLISRGGSNWDTKTNANWTLVDSLLSQAAKVYEMTGTFNGPTGRTLALPVAADAVTDYTIAITPNPLATGAVGDISVVQGLTTFTVYCSQANTTDTFEVSVIYVGSTAAFTDSTAEMCFATSEAELISNNADSDDCSVIFLAGTYSLTAAIAVTKDVYPLPGFIITTTPTFTFTATGHVTPVIHQWLSGGGAVLSGIKNTEIYPQWFGALGDGNTNYMTTAAATTHPEGYKVVTVFGVPATGVTKDAASLQEAIKAAGGKTVRIPYTGNDYYGSPVWFRDNAHLEFDSRVVWRVNETSLGDATVETLDAFRIANVDNVRLVGNGAQILGTFPQGEFTGEGASDLNHLINIQGSSNVIVEGFGRLYGISGDGISTRPFLTSDTDVSSITGNVDVTATRHCLHVRIRDNICDSNGRTGIAPLDGADIVVTGNTMKNTFGYNPQVGLNIEPNANCIVKDFVVRDNYSTGNYNGGFLWSPYYLKDQTAEVWLNRYGVEQTAGEGKSYGTGHSISIRGNESFYDRGVPIGCNQRGDQPENLSVVVAENKVVNAVGAGISIGNNTYPHVVVRNNDVVNPNSRMTIPVTSANDVLKMKYDGGVTTSVDIADGDYSEMSLVAAIQTAVDTAFTITSYATWDAETRAYTITAPVGHTLQYIDSTSDAGDLCGFTTDSAAARRITSDAAADFTGMVANPYASSDYHSNCGIYLYTTDTYCDLYSNIIIRNNSVVDDRPTSFTLTVATTEPTVGDILIGTSSGARAFVSSVTWPTSVTLRDCNGVFTAESVYNISAASTVGTIATFTDERRMWYGLATVFPSGATSVKQVNRVVVDGLEISGSKSFSTGGLVIDTSFGNPTGNYWKNHKISPPNDRKNDYFYHNTTSQSFTVYPGHSGWTLSNKYYSSQNKTYVLPEAKKGLRHTFINEQTAKRVVLLPRDFVTITSSNDVSNWKYDGGATTPIDIPDGTYTRTTLATAVQDALDAAFTISSTVTGSEFTRLFTVDVGGGHTIQYIDSGSDGGDVLGFTADSTAAQTNVSNVAGLFDDKFYNNSSTASSYAQTGTADSGDVGYLEVLEAICETEGQWTIHQKQVGQLGLSGMASVAQVSAGALTGKFVSPDSLAGSVHGERYVPWVIKPSDALTTVADGTDYFSVPSGMVGFELKDLTCSIHNLNAAAADSTVVVVRRCRAGVCVDMTSTGTTVAFGSYTESDEVIDVANDELAIGDKIFADVNGICTPAHLGLSCTATFRLP